jgi:membrane-associated protease RseP (regulator of RpoE activity)
MRRSILTTICILALLAVAAYPADCFSFEPGEFGYSSEDYFGGGSYLGVDTRDITADRLGPLHLKEESGVEVTMVDQDAPAGKAGLKEHDVILSVNGEQVESVEQLRRMIREIPGGRVVTIGISRDGQPLTLKAQLADRKGFAPQTGEFKLVMPAIPPMPPMPDIDIPVSVVVVHSSMRSGLMVENLTSQLADFFGAKDGHGVLVRSVEKGSSAEKAGFRAGDVITRVNGGAISDAGDFSHALRSGKDNTVSVGIIRDKKEQTLTLKLPERKQSGVFEESFGLPEISSATAEELSKMRVQVAEIKPQMELAARELQRVKPELEKQLQEFSVNRRQIEEQVQHAKRELEEQKDHLRQQLRERVRELKGSRADI